jgi:F-type H+-transporting ATPase subunit epsilon
MGYGELRVRSGQQTQRFYVDGGFVQVADNVVSVLTNRAVPSKAIDVAGAEESLRAALTTGAAGREEMAIRERRILQARGQLRVAARA